MPRENYFDGASELLPECAVCGRRMARSGRALAQLRENPHAFDGWVHRQCSAKSKVKVEARPAPTMVKKSKIETSLIGVDETLDHIMNLIKYGNKGIFLGGYHGLGKTSLVYELAKHMEAKVIRLQVTELLSEIDILGGLDIATGKFQYSEFVQALLDANEQKDKTFFLLLDEFTRGREEALNILFPLLAEKILFINSAYSEVKQIKLGDNVKVFGTGNIKDKGVREVGEAEFDRWNGVEILPITKTSDLKRMLGVFNIALPKEEEQKLFAFYTSSWEYGSEERILPMSHRTLIEAAHLAQNMIGDGTKPMESLKTALKLTYYVSSQAILNPNFKLTYEQIEREVY